MPEWVGVVDLQGRTWCKACASVSKQPQRRLGVRLGSPLEDPAPGTVGLEGVGEPRAHPVKTCEGCGVRFEYGPVVTEPREET